MTTDMSMWSAVSYKLRLYCHNPYHCATMGISYGRAELATSYSCPNSLSLARWPSPPATKSDSRITVPAAVECTSCKEPKLDFRLVHFLLRAIGWPQCDI